MKYEIKKNDNNTWNINIKNVDKNQLLKLIDGLLNIEEEKYIKHNDNKESKSATKEDLLWFYDRAKEMGREDIRFITVDPDGSVYGHIVRPGVYAPGWGYTSGCVKLGNCTKTKNWFNSLYECPSDDDESYW